MNWGYDVEGTMLVGVVFWHLYFQCCLGQDCKVMSFYVGLAAACKGLPLLAT